MKMNAKTKFSILKIMALAFLIVVSTFGNAQNEKLVEKPYRPWFIAMPLGSSFLLGDHHLRYEAPSLGLMLGHRTNQMAFNLNYSEGLMYPHHGLLRRTKVTFGLQRHIGSKLYFGGDLGAMSYRSYKSGLSKNPRSEGFVAGLFLGYDVWQKGRFSFGPRFAASYLLMENRNYIFSELQFQSKVHF